MTRPPPLDSVLSRSPVLITGGSGGIGTALARGFVQRGAAVHLVARREEGLKEAQDRCGAAAVHSCDVTDPDRVTSLFRHLEEEDALPGVVVNGAGSTHPGYFQALEDRIFRETMESNYFGAVNVLREAVPHMMERKEGYILNVSSVAGLVGVFGMSAYSAAKFAVQGLSEALRSELKPHGVVVSVLCPPDTRTRMLEEEVPLRPVETEALSPSESALSPEVVAQAAMKGLQRGKLVIVPGMQGKLTWWARRLTPGGLEWAMDRIIRKARPTSTRGG